MGNWTNQQHKCGAEGGRKREEEVQLDSKKEHKCRKTESTSKFRDLKKVRGRPKSF